MAVDLYFIFASSVAAIIARLVTHPIDTIKTRLQVSRVNTTIKDILRSAPLISLFDGLAITLLLCVPALTVYLSSYDTTKQILSEKLEWDKASAGTYMVAGLVAEALAGIFFTPMEVLKNRLQVFSSSSATQQQQQQNGIIEEENEEGDNNRVMTSLLPTYQHQPNNNIPIDNNNSTTKATFKLAHHVYKTEGWQGFYQGYWITLVVFAPQTMIYFIVYENLKLQFLEPTFFTYLLCALSSSVISVAICNPLDVVKTRWQVYHHHHHHVLPSSSFMNHSNIFHHYFSQSFDTMAELCQVMCHMYREEGYRAFLKGTLARVLWGAPMTTISFCIFEVLKDVHNKAN
ncbi:mitochondrial carrier domain-containing protein [Cunninghamella echinulata]|nr:mitochondrial carrier domain-containing protein [Cunninghamella echinulata]